jgi:hypothetical protein
MSPILIEFNSILFVNRRVVSSTLNVNLTLLVIPCKNEKLEVIDLQTWNYCHLLSGFSSKFQSFVKMFHR